MLTAVALSLRTSTRAVTASDAATAIREPSIEAVRALLVAPQVNLNRTDSRPKRLSDLVWSL
jgi:hypothetical protein